MVSAKAMNNLNIGPSRKQTLPNSTTLPTTIQYGSIECNGNATCTVSQSQENTFQACADRCKEIGANGGSYIQAGASFYTAPAVNQCTCYTGARYPCDTNNDNQYFRLS